MEDLDLSNLSVHELRRLANDRKVPGRAEMNREQLEEAIERSFLEWRVEQLEKRVKALEQKGRKR